MRIGIVTQPLLANYGGILQNFALQHVLKRMGHEVWTLDVVGSTWTYFLKTVAKLLLARLLGRNSTMPYSPSKIANKHYPLRLFVNQYISLTSPRTLWFEKRTIEKYKLNAVIVGSDQVWRPIYNVDVKDCFLNFVKNIKLRRVAYAASFGVDKWVFKPSQQRRCAKLAKQFDAISVREDSGIGLCRKYLGVDATHVLDPTLLLNKEDYSALCQNIEKREPYVFAYILDESEKKIQEIKTFAESKKLPYLIMSAGVKVEENDSIEKWLSNFRDAAYVITDSFHGTVFSIIFGKEFFVFENPIRGNSRLTSLLYRYNLESRIIKYPTEEAKPIDWHYVHNFLTKDKEKSILWLEKALSGK